MKTTTSLLTSIALLGSTTFAAESAGAAAAASSSSGGTAMTFTQNGNGVGKATITIDVNGKKETREIELGNATEVKVGGGNSVQVIGVANSGTAKAPRRTWLGLAADGVSEELRAQLPIADGIGLLVRSVAENGPAATAGMEQNDVLVKLDDQLLTNAEQLRALVGTKKQGDVVRLTFLRRGKETVAEVKLGEREGGDEIPPFGGILNGLSGLLNLAAPLQVQSRAIVVDKNGNVVTTRNDSQVADTVKQLEKTLRDSGVDGKAIDETKRALSEAMQSLQQAAGEIGATKGELAKRIEQAIKSATQAVEEGRKAAEQARQKAESAGGGSTLPPLEKSR